MKLPAGVLFVSIVCQAYAASIEAPVYIYDTTEPPSNREEPSISASTARLLLSQRLGLSQYHNLGDADGSALDILNIYGGKPKQIFENDEEWEMNKLLLMVEGVEYPEDIVDSRESPAFSIESPPHPAQNRQLALDLLEQDRYKRLEAQDMCSLRFPDSLKGGHGGVNSGRDRTGKCKFESGFPIDSHKSSQKSPISKFTESYELSRSPKHAYTSIFHISFLQGVTRKDGEIYKNALEDLKALLHKHQHQHPFTESTIILFPPSRNSAKRSTVFPYGAYNMPHSIRQLQPEEPLSPSLHPSPPETLHASAQPDTLQASSSPLPHGILPTCHSSPEICNATTNNCSGHGAPYLKSPGDTISCFACKCGKTETVDSEGRTKTVYWGGPACQKKDVSVPFFLLAGLTIGLVATVGWAIGLLFSIGQEDLPSVIGAGVAGPRAQK